MNSIKQDVGFIAEVLLTELWNQLKQYDWVFQIAAVGLLMCLVFWTSPALILKVVGAFIVVLAVFVIFDYENLAAQKRAENA